MSATVANSVLYRGILLIKKSLFIDTVLMNLFVHLKINGSKPFEVTLTSPCHGEVIGSQFGGWGRGLWRLSGGAGGAEGLSIDFVE
jgi:hypothetical protein